MALSRQSILTFTCEVASVSKAVEAIIIGCDRVKGRADRVVELAFGLNSQST